MTERKTKMELTTDWRKSTFCASSASCVEVSFQKSSFCGSATNRVEVGFRKAEASKANGNCVEVGECTCGGGTFYVRDSEDPSGPVLKFTRAEWAAFISGAKAGEFDH
jgi:hypothetical protein